MYNRKMIIAFSTILPAILLFSFLCACGINTNSASKLALQTSRIDTAIEATKEISFYPFEPGYAVKDIASLGSSMIILGASDAKNGIALASYETNANGEMTITYDRYCALNDPTSVDEQFLYGASSDEEFFYVLAGELPPIRYDEYSDSRVPYNQNFSGKFSVLKYTEQGEFLNKLIFSCLPSTEASIRGFVTLGESGFLVYTFDECFLFAGDGTLKSTINQNGLQFFGIQSCSEGIIASCFMNGSGFCTLLIEQNGNYTITNCPEASLCPCQSHDGQFLLNTGKFFCNYSFESERRKDILLWNNGEKIGSNCTGVVQLSDQVFAYTMVNSDAFFVIANVEQPIGERAVIHIARCGSAVSNPSFHTNSTKYVYQYEDYGDLEMDRLRAEIIGGNGPDLILFNNNLDTSSSLFEDLYQFLDNDQELSRESFLPNYLSALETNGELHELWTECSIITLAARASDVGDGEGMTTADYDRILSENDKYEAIFDNYMTKDELLQWIANISLSEFVDKDTATCRFDDQAFADLLTWCSRMTSGFAPGEIAWGYDMSQVVLTTLWLDQMSTVHELWNIYGEKPVFAGFPTHKGYGNFYYSIYENCCMAIPKNCNNKNGAWEFVREQLITDRQMYSSHFPINFDAFQRMALEELTKDEYESLLLLMQHTTKNVNYSDQKLREIIISAGTAYLKGDKSLDETVKLIQDKASIYISERYG